MPSFALGGGDVRVTTEFGEPARHGLMHLAADAMRTATLCPRRTCSSAARIMHAAAATAHPAKFDTIVEPAIGRQVNVPPSLATMLAREASAEPLAADRRLLAEWLRGW